MRQRVKEIDRVLADIGFGREIRRDVDHGIGDEQGFRITRHIHDIDVRQAMLGAQSRRRRDNGFQKLVGVQRTFHNRFDFSCRGQLGGFGGGRMAMLGVDQLPF